MLGTRLSTVLLIALSVLSQRHALAGPPAALEWQRVARIIDGDTVALADGQEVRLVGIQAPKPPLGRPDLAPWAPAREAKAALAELVSGRDVGLWSGGRARDRHGRILAHLVLADGRWVQEELLTSGHARVYTFADNRSLAREMLAREQAARAAGRGIWSHPFYAVRPAGSLRAGEAGFMLVKGRVRDATQVRGRVYLNFGSEWKRDFTVSIAPDRVALFRDEGLEPGSLEGCRIRVRGWVKTMNGPMIEVTHPEQIEVPEPAP